MVICEIEVP